jgi:hypothetical protein
MYASGTACASGSELAGAAHMAAIVSAAPAAIAAVVLVFADRGRYHRARRDRRRAAAAPGRARARARRQRSAPPRVPRSPPCCCSWSRSCLPAVLAGAVVVKWASQFADTCTTAFHSDRPRCALIGSVVAPSLLEGKLLIVSPRERNRASVVGGLITTSAG